MTKLIKSWEELSKCKSKTHTVDIDMKLGGGWIVPKVKDKNDVFGGARYLSTHTFYGSEYEHETKLLQSCGFDIQLVNWDEVGL